MLLLKSADKLGLADDVALHGLLEILFGGGMEAVQRDVERVKLEEVAVAPDGRARSSVTFLLHVVHSVCRPSWQGAGMHALWQAAEGRRKVVNHPVNEGARGRLGIGRVRIVDDERQALRVLRHARP